MKLIRLLLLIIIFAGGIFVGNKYLPEQNATAATAVSLPQIETYGADINQFTSANALKVISDYKAALTANTATAQQKEEWLKFLETTLRVQQFKNAHAKYLAEIAKNKSGTPLTSDYNQSASAFNATKKSLETYFLSIKPADLTPAAAEAAPTEPAAASAAAVQTAQPAQAK